MTYCKSNPSVCNKQGNLLVQVFNVVPTFLEVSLVAGILAYKCGPAFAGLTAATITLYTLVTFAITSVSLLCHPPPPNPPPPPLPHFYNTVVLMAPVLSCNPSLSPLQPHDPLDAQITLSSKACTTFLSAPLDVQKHSVQRCPWHGSCKPGLLSDGHTIRKVFGLLCTHVLKTISPWLLSS